MALSDEAKKKCDELATIYANNDNLPQSPYNACARKAYAVGFNAGVEFERERMSKLAVNVGFAERARTQKLVEALEFYASLRLPPESGNVYLVTPTKIIECKRWELAKFAQQVLEAHKAGE